MFKKVIVDKMYADRTKEPLVFKSDLKQSRDKKQGILIYTGIFEIFSPFDMRC